MSSSTRAPFMAAGAASSYSSPPTPVRSLLRESNLAFAGGSGSWVSALVMAANRGETTSLVSRMFACLRTAPKQGGRQAMLALIVAPVVAPPSRGRRADAPSTSCAAAAASRGLGSLPLRHARLVTRGPTAPRAEIHPDSVRRAGGRDGRSERRERLTTTLTTAPKTAPRGVVYLQRRSLDPAPTPLPLPNPISPFVALLLVYLAPPSSECWAEASWEECSISRRLPWGSRSSASTLRAAPRP